MDHQTPPHPLLSARARHLAFEPVLHELRLAWRGLRRTKGFATAAVLTLAVGMAGATSMFTLIQGVLLRPLPMPDPDRLVVVWKALPATGSAHWPFRAAEVDLIRDADRTFARVAAVGYNEPSQSDVFDGTSTDRLHTARVSGDFFDVLGVRPLIGRALTRDDDAVGAEPVLVLTHDSWQRRYGGAIDVIGTRLTIGEQRFAIVGIMPPGIDVPRGVDAWMTIEARTGTTRNPTFQEAVRNELDVVARLQPDVTRAQAASELGILAPRLDETAPPGSVRGVRPTVHALADVMVGDVRAGLLVLFAAVGLVLLIACANVANLLLVRGEIRRPELALRMALGASRQRLIGQIAAESLLLAAIAGVIGLGVTWGSLHTLLTLAPGELPRVDTVRLDGGVVLFVFALSLLTTVAAGLVPAFVTGRLTLASDVHRGGRLARHDSRRGRRVLVAVQVALAVIVVSATGLIARSVLGLQSTGTALGAERLALVSLALPQERYADRARHLGLLEDLVARLAAAPAIATATPVDVAPFSGVGWDVPAFVAEGQDAARAAANGALTLEAIHPQYFDTFAVPIVRGRAFEEGDRQDSPAVAIVSEDVAARLWPGEDPIGRRVKMGAIDSPDVWRTIVGVAARTRYRDLRTSRATLYVPAEQLIVTAQSLVVRSDAPLSEVAAVVRDEVRAVDPGVRVSRVTPFVDLLQEPLARPRFYAILLGLFGVSALLLAAVGLYAVIAASIRQRYGEIGVRLAVGATPADVRRLILREGLSVAAIGAAAGLMMTVLVTRFLSGLLYEVHPLDPATLVAAILLVLGGAALAVYMPARMAARIQPFSVLRV